METKSLFLAKARASGLHFMLSLAVVATVLALATWLWYPPGLRIASGFFNLILILVLVDLVLGPALTALVYRPAKASLKFDLGVIAVLQVAALVYGGANLYQARPVFVAFVVDRYELVSAADIEPESLEQAQAPFNRFPQGGVQWVMVKLPEDPRERDQLTLAEALHGTGPSMLPKLYQPLPETPKAILARSKPLGDLAQFNDEARLQRSLPDKAGDAAGLRFVPLRAIGRDMTVLLNAHSGRVVDVVDLRPWES